MGVVVMGRGGTMKFKGAYSTELVGCLYCDSCGSFNLGRDLTFKNFLWLFIAAIIPFLIWYFSQTVMSIFGSLVCFGGLLFLVLKPMGALELGYICVECGNTQITFVNVLGYSENDRGVLDVPFEDTQKLYKWGMV